MKNKQTEEQSYFPFSCIFTTLHNLKKEQQTNTHSQNTPHKLIKCLPYGALRKVFLPCMEISKLMLFKNISEKTKIGSRHWYFFGRLYKYCALHMCWTLISWFYCCIYPPPDPQPFFIFIFCERISWSLDVLMLILVSSDINLWLVRCILSELLTFL